MGKMTRKGGDLGQKGRGTLNFKQLFLLTRVLLRAALYRYQCPFFVAEQRKGERKSARTFPPGPPRHCHAAKRNKRGPMYISYAVPQALPTRVAGRKSKSFCPWASAAFYNRLLRNQKFCIRASHDARLQRANKTSIFRRRRNGHSQALKQPTFAPQSEKL